MDVLSDPPSYQLLAARKHLCNDPVLPQTTVLTFVRRNKPKIRAERPRRAGSTLRNQNRLGSNGVRCRQPVLRPVHRRRLLQRSRYEISKSLLVWRGQH